MRLLVVDAGSINRDRLRSHLEPRYGPLVEFVDVDSPVNLASFRANGKPIDAALIGWLEPPEPQSQLLAHVTGKLPGVPLVVIHPAEEYPVPWEHSGENPVAFVPRHQLALLPVRIEQLTTIALPFAVTEVDCTADEALAMDPYQIIASQTSDFVYFVEYDPDGSLRRRHRSEGVSRLTGFERSEITAIPLADLIHPDDMIQSQERLSHLKAGQPRVDEYRIRTKSGRVCWVRDFARPVMSEDGSYIARIVGAGQDITNQKLAQMRLTAQAAVLSLIAEGEPAPKVLSALIEMVEEQIPDARCSVQIVDQSGRYLYHQAAPRLPQEFVSELGAIPVSKEGGVTGNAAFYGELVICRDIAADPRFTRYTSLAQRYGLNAIWSNPVLAADGSVIGTFATYYDAVRDPEDFEISLLEVAAQLAGIALEKERRESDLLFAEVRYRALVEQTPAVTFASIPDNLFSFSYVSPKFVSFFGGTPHEAIHAPHRIWPRIHPEDRSSVKRALDHAVMTGEDLEVEFRSGGESSAVTWIQCQAALLRDRHGIPTHWQGVMLDVTERNEANRRLAESEQRYRSLFEDNLNAVFTYDLEGRIQTVNPAAERISGYSSDELIGQTFNSILAPDEYERAGTYMNAALLGVPQHAEIAIIGKHGDRIELNISKSPILVDGKIVGVSGIAEDVTDRNRLEAELVHQAHHDPLTGLPNRNYFFDHLAESFCQAGDEHQLAVLFLDLNNFKVINDSLGHDVGDQYLKRIASVLRAAVSPDSLVARFGGDEFTILVPDRRDAAAAARDVAERLMTTLRKPLTVDGFELGSNVSIGIAVSAGESDDTPNDVVRRADIALYDAKQTGHDSRYAMFSQGMDEWVFERLWIERDLLQALQTDQIEVYYQPIIDLRTDRPVAVEALVRWRHPTRGLLSPGRFVRIAEETGHIIELDSQVLRTACAEVARWNLEHPKRPPLRLGVNISAREFWHAGFVERVMGILERTGFDPSLLRIEITESTMMQDVSLATSLVQDLRWHGVQFAIDDFGTGYSSLSYLRQFPVDVLKIDRSFIQSLDDDSEQLGVVQAIVSIARALNLRVVAEGIETIAQYNHAKALGSDMGQGFLMAHPQRFESLRPILDTQRPGWL